MRMCLSCIMLPTSCDFCTFKALAWSSEEQQHFQSASACTMVLLQALRIIMHFVSNLVTVAKPELAGCMHHMTCS